MLKVKEQIRILKISIKTEVKMKTFSDRQKLGDLSSADLSYKKSKKTLFRLRGIHLKKGWTCWEE